MKQNKNNIKRIMFDLVIFLVFGSIAYHLFTNADMIADSNPFYITLLIPFKLSAGVIHWFIFRKLVNYFAKPVDWNKSYKEATLNDIFAIISFIMFIWAYTSFS